MQLVNNKKIVVVGSIAIDNTIFTKELPHAGTTTIADNNLSRFITIFCFIFTHLNYFDI